MTTAIVAFLILLVPGMIACTIYTWLQQKHLDTFSFIVSTFAFSLLINLFTFFVMALLGTSVEKTADLFLYVSSTMKFGALALAVSIVFPGLVWLLAQLKREKI